MGRKRKLNEDQNNEIRCSTLSAKELSVQFNVSKATIYSIRNKGNVDKGNSTHPTSMESLPELYTSTRVMDDLFR